MAAWDVYRDIVADLDRSNVAWRAGPAGVPSLPDRGNRFAGRPA